MTRCTAGSHHDGAAELRRMAARVRGLVGFVGLLSLVSSLLMLTGPIYMLQVYDRVLSSRSEATLVSLTLLAAFLFAMMGFLDWARGRIMARIGARFQLGLRERTFDTMLRGDAQDAPAAGPQSDLDTVQRLLASPVMLALFDLPWVPVFMLGIWLFHPWLGFLAIGGALLLVGVSLVHQVGVAGPGARALESSRRADDRLEGILCARTTVRGLGMGASLCARWSAAADDALKWQLAVADRGGAFGALTRVLRLFLQSAMLGLGALLVLGGEMSAGAMIAGSILLGRALMPVEQVIANRGALDQARRAWRALGTTLSHVPPRQTRMPLPRPRASVRVQQITVVPPGGGAAALRGVTLSLEPGEAVGVIGPSGAGKSSLAQAMTGLWPAGWGKLRLDGAPLEQYAPDVLGRLIGYLPQRVQLFEGTIAENIARMDAAPDPDAVIRAARKAGAHEMILAQPGGYDTPVDTTGAPLSGGQAQRVGLARALYGDPVLLVLDEPAASLDRDGQEAVDSAIRRVKAEGGAALIMAHDAASLGACDLLLVLEGGMARCFGPRDRVLEQMADWHASGAGPDREAMAS